MDKMGILSVVFVSIPEQVLFVVTIALMIARFDLVKLNRENKSNLFKIGLVSICNTVFVVLLRAYSPFFLINLVAQVLFVIGTYVIVLRIRWDETIVATIIAYLEFMVLEFAYYLTLLSITGISIDVILNSEILRISSSIPLRLAQIAVIIIIKRIPIVIIDLKPFKYMSGFIAKFALTLICFSAVFLQLASVFRPILYNIGAPRTFQEIEQIILTIVFALVILISLFITIYKYKIQSEKNRRDYLDAISHIDSLLNNGNSGIIKAKEILSIEKARWGGKK